MSLSFVYLYVIQAFYEFVFGKYGITCGFGIFKTLPRELVPIDDPLTLAGVGVEGTVAIEECDECPAPLTYIDDSVEDVLRAGKFLLMKVRYVLACFNNVIIVNSYMH